MADHPQAGTAQRLLDRPLVVELGQRIAAGACGSLLAQLGAEVVLVEPPAPDGQGKWANRPAIAAGKRSLVVDPASAADRALLDRLLRKADVILLSTDRGELDRALWAQGGAAGQVLCDITAFGHEGPLAGLGLPECLVQAWTGVLDTNGFPDRQPVPVRTPVLEMSTAAYAASAVIAALRVRRLQGLAQRIDMTLYDAGVNALVTFLPLELTGRPARRIGNGHPNLSPWNCYRTADGWVVICAPTNDQWRRLCEAMEVPQYVTDPRFATPSGRLDNAPETNAVVAAWVAQRPVREVIGPLARSGIVCGPIVELEQVFAEPNLKLRDMILELKDPVSGEARRIAGSPFRADPAGGLAPTSIPAPGADRDAVEELMEARPPLPRAGASAPRDPLEGVRVVEIGQNTVAPLASRQLGALGADVIKVEPPGGEAARFGAPLRENGQSYVFALSNADKRGIVLNLRDPRDRQTLERLLQSADVLLENLKPGTLATMGLGPAELRERFPRLVYASANGFGVHSAYPGRPALDTLIQAMSGVMDANAVEGMALKSGISISDILGGQFGLLSALAGLEYRDRTGQAPHFDLSMQDTSTWATQMLWNGAPPTETACAVVSGAEGLIARTDDPPAEAPVLPVAAVMEHAQTRARGLLIERNSSDGDSWPVLASPLRLLLTPARVRRAMARLGALDPALAAELGLDATQAAS